MKWIVLTGMVAGMTALSLGLWDRSVEAEDQSGNCNLKGVEFSDLSFRQLTILQEVGATCGNGSNKRTNNELKFGKKGYIKVNDRTMSFLDFSVESPSLLLEGSSTVYGYIGSVNLDKKVVNWGFDYRTVVSEGEVITSTHVSGTKPSLDVVVSGRSMVLDKGLSVENIEAAKSRGRKIYRALVISDFHKALVKIEGVIKKYGNSSQLFLLAHSIEVIDRP